MVLMRYTQTARRILEHALGKNLLASVLQTHVTLKKNMVLVRSSKPRVISK